MTFRDADALFLFALVPLLGLAFVYAWRRRRAANARFGSETMLGRLVLGGTAKPRAARAVIVLVGVALMVLAFAGPQYGSRQRLLRKRGIDVVVALDFSKSMLARDVRPNRLDRAKSEVRRLLDELGGDRVGIVAFAGETMEFPMTVDYGSIELFLRDLGPYDMPVGGTAIGRALVASQRLLERARASEPRVAGVPTAEQVVILVTDGEDHEGDPLAAADELHRAGIRTYVLGVGSRAGEPIPTYSPDGTWTGYMRGEDGQVITTALTADNERQLQQIAQRTSGKYFRAREGSLSMEPIRRELRRLRATERRARRVTIAEDRFALVLLPAFLLLVLEGLLPEGLIGLRKRRKEAGA